MKGPGRNVEEPVVDPLSELVAQHRVTTEDAPAPEPLLAIELPAPLAFLERGLFQLLRLVTIAALLLLLGGLSWTMIRRQIGGIAIPDEFVMLLFTWMLFVGAAALLRDWNHIEVPLVQELLPSRRWRLLHHALLIVISLVFVWVYYRSSLGLIAGARNRTSPMLQIPQIYWYGSLLTSAALMGFYAVLRLVLVVVALVREPRHDQVTRG